MPLPEKVIDYLTNNAQANGVTGLGPDDDLFVTGTLDSFALVDFVTVVEEYCGIKIPDADIVSTNFQTIDAIEKYLQSRGY